MTDPRRTGTTVFVLSTFTDSFFLVADGPLPVTYNPGDHADLTHRDLQTGTTALVLVHYDADPTTIGWLVPNPDRCALCAANGHITVREGLLPRDKHDQVLYPVTDLIAAWANGIDTGPISDEPVDIHKPCPICRNSEYLQRLNEEWEGKC
jgi:hypothetical protein